ncbi:MAG: M48 family metalloprotease [Bacteroidota bacterium]
MPARSAPPVVSHTDRTPRSRPWILSLFIVLLVASGCATTEESLVTGRKRAYGYTWEQERQIGQESDPQIVAQYGLYNDEDLAAYVDSLGQALLAVSHVRRPGVDPKFSETPFTFRVLDSPVVNAFALPGGYIYVTRGLMAHVGSEAQLAVVLGHEIGHVVGRHASVRAVSQQFGQLGLIAGAVIGQGLLGGDTAQNVLGVGGQAAQLLFLSWGRDNERESDELGVEYAALESYEAGEGAEFFVSLQRISAQQGARLPTWQSTHPDPGEREVRIREMASDWNQDLVMNKVRRDPYLRRIDGLTIGENPRQGFVENGTFYHPDLAFQYDVPLGYTVINQQTQVVMVESEQQAYQILRIADEERAQEAAAAFAGQEGLTNVSQGPVSNSRFPTYYVLADAQLDETTQVRLIDYFVEYQGTVYSFLGLSAVDAFPTYRPIFEGTVGSFQALTDPQILAIEPTRLRVVEVQQDQPFRALLPATLPEGFDAEGLAILNQVGLDETLPAGTLVKLPR